MKKSNRPSGQTTLLQSWNKQISKRPKPNAKSLFQTWENPGENQTEIPLRSVFSNDQPPASRNETNLEDIINMDDDEDDNELLNVVDKMDCCHTGNLSFSARSCADGDNTANEVIPGFDCSTGNSWIYPTNYPVRDYQFNIVEQALYQNTLVTLPTGLGKTFIAAVVMYNFYRWYPQGKLVFMAPTKPLVAQQIDACYNIMGIPQQDTAEMTGNMAPTKRELLWKQKRVFFLTPQVFQNDLSRGSCRADDVVCLVIDEAHKALGNHAYCQVVRDVLNYNPNFRVLALSATPGDGIKAVQRVITNLLVSHIELRSEDSADIKPYTHQRQVEKIVVKLGDDLEFFKTKFLRVLNVVVSRLARNQVIWNRDAEKLSKYMLLMSREQFRKNCASGQQQQPHNQIGSIEGDFAVGISFYHAYELLLQHGLLSFYNFMKGVVDGTKGSSRAKIELTRSPDFVAIMEDLREQIELPPDQSDGNVTMFSEVSPTGRSSHDGAKINPSFVGHPKLLKLKDIVLEHFRARETANHVQSNTGSRVMIFSQFRDSVQEIASMFSAHKPLVRVMRFIGQQSKGTASKGLTQKEQLEVIRQFRNGGYNTLVATCVGEEGLDIGEVDLIICFDASASPIRLVQRMGRTGRKRAGRIVVLVTEGKEEQIYQRSLRNKSNIHKTILEAARTLDLYLDNPRMVPKNLNPVCQKMFITVENKSPKKSKAGKPARKSSDGDIKKLLTSRVTARKEDGFLSPQELCYWHENFKLPHHEAGLTPSRSITTQPRARESGGQQQPEHALSLTEWTAWQSTLQPVSFVDHSKRAKHFTEILEFCDFRRDCGENDDLYDLEMRSFLNSEDIMKPGDQPAREAHQGAGTSDCGVEPGTYGKNRQEKQNKKKRKKDIVISDDEDSARDQGEGCTRGKTKTQRTIWDYQDIVQPGDEPACQTHQGTGTDSNGKSAQQKKNGKKRKKEMISDHEDDSEDEEKATTKRTTGDLREQDGKLSVTKKSARKSSAESKVKKPSKKRISTDFEFPDDDFEDVPFSSTRVEDKMKKDGASPPERQRKVSVSRGVRPKFQGGCDSEDSSSEHDLSKLLDIPSSQRPRDVDRGPVSDVLPDAPSLDSLLGLSSLNAGHCFQENPGDCSPDNSSPLDGRKDALQEDQDLTVSPRVAAETPKTSKFHRNDPKRTESTHGSRKARPFKGGLFKGRSSDETTDEEGWGLWDMQDLGGYADIPEEQGESEKRDIAASHKNSWTTIHLPIPWKTPRKSLEEHGTSSHNTKSTNFVSEIPRSKDVESRIQEDNPDGGGSTVFGSGLVCDVETPSKEDDGIEFGFDREFGNSFFDDDNGLNDFRTPNLFDDFDCEETSNRKVNAVKACTYDDTTCKTVDEIKDFTNKDGTDGEVVAVRDTTGRGRNLGKSDSNKEVANKNAAIERSGSLKIFFARNGTNISPQGTEMSASENHANGQIDVVKANTDKKVIVKRDTSSHILSKKNPSDREATTLEALARNDATSTELASVEDLVGTDKGKTATRCSASREPLIRRLEAASKSLAAEGVDNDRTDAVGCTSRSKKPFQNLVQTKGSGEMTEDAISKQPSVVDRSLTKIRSFSFGRTRDERTQLPRDRTSELRDSAHDDELYSLDHEDPDVVAPSPRRRDLHRSFFVSLKDDRNNIRNTGSKETAPVKLSPGAVRKNRLKLRSKAKDSSEIKSSQGFCNDAADVESSNSKLHFVRSLHVGNSQAREIEDKKLKTSPLYPPVTTNSSFSSKETSSYTNVCLQAAKFSEGFSNQAVKGRLSLSNSSSQLKPLRDHDELNDDHGSTDSEPERENASPFEKDSPFVIKRSKKKNSKAFGGKVLDSEEESEDNEQNNFKNDQSLVFNGTFSKRTSFGEFGNQVEQLLAPVSDDDEFEAEERTTCNRKRKLPAHRERNISKKSKQQKRRPVVSEFFEEEAEVSDDVDGFDSPGEEPDVSDDVFDESFIDDRTQLTQRSPIVMEREKNKKETVQMMDIYRTSLLTPNRAQLRFHTPAFHRSKNRYKMVYNKGRPAPSSSSSQTDVDERDVSEVVDVSCESDEADASEHEEEVRPMSVSPDESQIVVPRNRPWRKRVLSESPETPTTGTENQTGKTRSREPVSASPRVPPVAMGNLHAGHPRHGLSRISKNSNEQLSETGDRNFRPGSVSSNARDSRVGLDNSHAGRFSLSKNSNQSFSETGDRMFKRPYERIWKHVNSVVRGKTQTPTGFGDNEEIDGILAALKDSDESLMMEIGAMPTCSTGSGNTTSTSNNYPSNTSKTKLSSNQSEQRETTWSDSSKQDRTFGHLESGVKSSRLMGNTTLSSDSYASNTTKTKFSSNQSEQREITWNDSSKQERSFGHLESGVKSSRLMGNTTLSSDNYASNTTKTKFSSNQSEQREITWKDSSKQDRTFGHLESGVKSSRLMGNTTLSSDSYASNTTKTKSPTNQSEQRETTWNNASKQERTFEHLESGVKNNSLNNSYSKLHSTSSNGQHGSRIDPYPKGNTRTIVSPHKNVSSDRITDIQEPVQRGEQVSNTKPGVETSFRANGIKKDLHANPKPKLFSSYNQNMVKSCNSESGGKELKTSPLFLNPDSSCSSRKGSDSYGNVIRDATAEPSTSFEKTIIVDSSDAKRDAGGPTAITSPALTAAQRDKNKLTVLVGSKELSNCQIVSFLRRKHNIKAVVCQITGCDYIVSNRMGVERRLVSDISNPTNINKLTERVRELCDLHDRPCLVIEKDRLKQGETENTSEVRNKYFDRVLACLAQTHVKVLFSDSQEGTSNILALLAQVEAKKNAAIIYPLPLSKDKEQVVKFLNSIPRTSYITAVSLCYHNRTLRDIFNSSAEDLVKRTKNLSLTRAKDIVKFLQHGFCIDMVSSGNT